MEDKNLDKQIKKALNEGTEESLALKDATWKKIEQNLKNNTEGVAKMKQTSFNLGKFGFAAAAVVLAFALMVGTTPGQAGIKKIKNFLVPQKQIVEKLEGQKEKNDVSLEESKVGYRIYFNHERYLMESKDGKDRIIPRVPVPSGAPEVYMEIDQVKDKAPQVILTEIQAELTKEFPTVRNIGFINDPLKAQLLIASNGSKWNSKIIRVFLMDNTEGGTFIIKQQYFLEAEEGHGARFNNMLKEFRIVKEQK